MVDAQLKPVRERKRDQLLSRRPRLILGLACSSLLLVAAVITYPGSLGENFHPVIPGQVYRSGQLTAESLQSHAGRYGIRSVINFAVPTQETIGMTRSVPCSPSGFALL